MSNKLSRNMKLILTLLLFISIIFFSLIYISRPIRIAFLAPLSGPTSNFGISGRNGALLAVEKINSSRSLFDRPIELYIEDDENSKEVALKKMQAFHANSIDIVIANTTSSTVKGIINYADANDMIIFSPSASSAEYSDIDDNFIRIAMSSSLIGKSLADTVISNNHSDITFIKDTSNLAFTDVIEMSFIEAFINSGGSDINLIEIESDSFDGFDYDNLYEMIENNNSDAIVLATNDVKTRFILQNLNKDNSELAIYSTSWAITNYLLTKSGEGSNGLYFVDLVDFSDNADDLGIVNYKLEYRNKYNESPEIHSLRAYDATNILYNILNKMNELNSKSIKKNLIKNHHKSLQGEFFINKYGDIDKSLNIFRIEDGKYKRVKE